jgi:hypothetical protein
VTGKKTLKGYLRETQTSIREGLKRSSRLLITWTQISSHYGIPIVSKRELGNGLLFFIGLGTTFRMVRMPPLPYMSNGTMPSNYLISPQYNSTPI